MIRDGFVQMLEILLSVSRRKNGDLSPLQQTIVFNAPPRMDEFFTEMNKIIDQLDS